MKISKTKRRILDTTRDLFNKRGLYKVSQHTIAEALDMSPGNLTYHYKKKDDLVKALYNELLAHLDKVMETEPSKVDTAEQIEILDALNSVIYNFRFFYQDLQYIIDRNPTIKKSYKSLLGKRRKLWDALIKNLIKAKLLTKEEYKGQHDMIYEMVVVVFTKYLSMSKVLGSGKLDASKLRHRQMVLSVLYPYMTAAGKKKFKKYIS